MNEHILVVDDEAPIRGLLAEYFRKRGHEASTASDGMEAEQILEGADIKLVILDLLLPDVDGMDLLRKIKETYPELPVIVMTGIGFDEEVLQEARENGASGYVSKTLPLNQLLMEVHRVLRQNHANHQE